MDGCDAKDVRSVGMAAVTAADTACATAARFVAESGVDALFAATTKAEDAAAAALMLNTTR